MNRVKHADTHVTYWDHQKSELVCIVKLCEANLSNHKKWKKRRKSQEHNIWLDSSEDQLAAMADSPLGRTVFLKQDPNKEVDEGLAWWNGADFVIY